jgi:hypothetical protein
MVASKGAAVLVPFGHSPDYDLVAEIDSALLRIQVKTTTQESETPNGHLRHPVAVRTSGGNQSWTGTSKKLDPSLFDYLFVVTARGRRWFIPAAAIDARDALVLGGPKYGEYEIEPGRVISDAVYGNRASIESTGDQGEYPRGQRTAAVNRQALPSQVRLLPPPLASPTPIKPTNRDRKLGKSGHALINQKRRMTIPQKAFFEAGFQNGSKVRVRSLGHGRIVIEQVEFPSWAEPASG